MKKLILAFLFVIFSQTYSYEKLSIVERFTNASCAPCASINNSWYNVTTQDMVSSGSIAHIIYNGWWPGPNDPMYLLNQTDNTTRINYYGVNAVPWIVVNGSTISTSQAAMVNAVNNGNSQYSPFQISLTQNALSENLIELNLIITRDPSDTTTFTGTIRLRFGLTEKTVAYASPPGSNGESEFYSVCRKMLPDAGGSVITIPAQGESTEILLQYVPTSGFISSVNFDSLRAVAYIQRDDNKFIYQSFMMDLIPNFVAQINQTTPDIIADNNTAAEFTTTLSNIGFANDTYYITPVLNGPDGWTGQYTTVNGTFDFDQLDSVEIAVGGSTEISIEINPNGIDGFGETFVNFTSVNEPGVSGSALLRNITTTGIDLLVIDASDEGYGSTITNSLENLYSGTFGIVSNEAVQNPGVDLSNYLIIMWSVGNSLPVFISSEVTALEDYLNQDGRFFINGQNIGSDIFEPGGQSQFAQSFFNNYLHADYVADFGGSYFINGITGDPITTGIAFPLNDLYDRSPDQVAPFDADATPILKFGSTTNYAGLKTENENYRVVYFSLGLEQISDGTIRDTLVSRIINWLMEGIVVPVELSSFSASATSSYIQLEWTTASELNNRGFEIEKSTDGNNFYNIGFREGAGTTTETKYYSFNDKISLTKKTDLYYRLKQIDYNGKTEYSNVLKVLFDMPIEFVLGQNYPNPFNPSTKLSYSIAEDVQVSLKIYDIMGAEVAELVNDKQAPGFYEVQFDASGFSSGMYFYKLSARDFTSIKKMTLIK